MLDRASTEEPPRGRVGGLLRHPQPELRGPLHVRDALRSIPGVTPLKSVDPLELIPKTKY